MEDKKKSKQGRAAFARFQEFKKGMAKHTQYMNDLGNEILYLDDKLDKLNSEIDILQIKKTELDEMICESETVMDELIENMKKLDFLKIHLAALNQRKQILEDYSLENGLKYQAVALQNKVDTVWEYYDENISKLDEEINGHELKNANRNELVSNLYEKEFNKYKTSIELLKVENDILSKKLNLIIKLQ